MNLKLLAGVGAGVLLAGIATAGACIALGSGNPPRVPTVTATATPTPIAIRTPFPTPPPVPVIVTPLVTRTATTVVTATVTPAPPTPTIAPPVITSTPRLPRTGSGGLK